MDAIYQDGELRLLTNGRAAIENIFIVPEEGQFIAAQWYYLASTTNVSEKTKAKTIADKLCTIYSTDNPALQSQFIKYIQECKDLDSEIRNLESNLSSKIYHLYELTKEEIKLVEGVK